MNPQLFGLLSAVLVLSLALSACSSGNNNNTSGPSAPSSQPAASESASTEASAEPASEKLSLNWFVWVNDANANLPDSGKDFVKATIEEKFNVELNLEYMVSGEDYINKTNVLLASTPPDMWKDATPEGGNRYAADGLLADMTPFVSQETMPNYFAHWITQTELERYQILNMYVRAPIPFNRGFYRTFYIRKDWLDRLGLEVPNSYDDYLTAMRAFRNDDPDGNGAKDTYGYTLSGGGANLGWDWPEYLKNGLPFAMKVENNQYIDIQTDPRMASVIDDIVNVIGEDLVDPDWFLNKSPQHIEKAIQGKAGIVFGSAPNFAFDSNPQGIQARTQELFPGANWVPMNLFPDAEHGTAPNPGNPFLFPKAVADSEPEKIERSVQILDWLAGEEGYVLTHYGQEGKHYTRDGQTITLNVGAFAKDVIEQGNFLTIWSFFTPADAASVFGLSIVDPRETDRDRDIRDYFSTIKLYPTTGVQLIAPENFDWTFRTRMNELISKAVLSDKSGEHWPEYREELMVKYKGNDLVAAYTQNFRDAGVIE